MAKKVKLSLTNDNLFWNADRRYKINTVVEFNSKSYQNITGKNSQPDLLVDWQFCDVLSFTIEQTVIQNSQNAVSGGAVYSQLALKEDLLNKNIANGYAGLGSDGKINPLQLPALAISETYPVSSQTEMLALSQAEQGDVAIRSDISKSYILRASPSSVLSNWSELLSPTDAVTSVNGQIGVVNLTKSDVGLGNVDNTSDLNKPISTATQTALNSKEPTIPTGTASEYIKGDKTLGTFPTIPMVDQTIIDGSTNAVSGNAVFDGLATKAPISSVHNPVTIGTANGLSLSTQQLSLGLASSGVTGALSGTDWNTFNGKFNTPTGLTTNYIPKWNGSGFGNSSVFDNGINVGIGTTNPTANLTVKGAYSVGSSIPTNWALLSAGRTGVAKNNKGLYFDIFNDYAEVSTYDWSLGQAYPMVFQGNGGNSMFGTNVDNGVDLVQVAGTITASPAVSPNQVVVKSQLDAMAGTSGSYTPTISNLVNCSAVTNLSATYIKIGNIVSVNICCSLTVTTQNTSTTVDFSLPVSRVGTTVINAGVAIMPANGATQTYPTNCILASSTQTVRFGGLPPQNTSGSGVKLLLTFQYDVTQ